MKNAMTVTMATHSSQVAAVSHARVITTSTQLISATVTGLLGGASLVCLIPLASVVNAVNPVTMGTLLREIAQVS